MKTALVTLALATSGAASAGQEEAKETIEYTYDPLGRLVVVKHSGVINAGQAHSICYDAAGNRTIYKSSSTGVVASCPPPTTPTPTPTPGPTNGAPNAAADTGSVEVCSTSTVHALNNDSDPDGDALVITSVTGTSYVSGWISPTGTVNLGAGSNIIASTILTYTISDGNGGTDTGSINVEVVDGPECPSTDAAAEEPLEVPSEAPAESLSEDSGPNPTAEVSSK